MPVSRKRPSASAVSFGAGVIVTSRQILLLEPVTAPFLGPDGFEPGTEVFPGRGADLQHLEGRAGDRLPFEIDDLAGDRPVLDELKRQVVTPAARGNFHPAEPVADRRRHDDGLFKSEFLVLDGELSPPAGEELEAAVRSGRRGLVRRVRVPGNKIAEGRRGRSSHRRRAAHPARAPAREPGPSRVCRTEWVRAAGPRPRPAVASERFGLATAFCEGPSWSETSAADAPQAIRPAARSVSDASVSFWSNMTLNTS